MHELFFFQNTVNVFHYSIAIFMLRMEFSKRLFYLFFFMYFQISSEIPYMLTTCKSVSIFLKEPSIAKGNHFLLLVFAFDYSPKKDFSKALAQKI